MTTHSKEYTDYMQSNKWRTRCKQLRQKRGNICEMCGRNDRPLEVHHKNYDRLGHELDDDLMIVCRDECHPRADRERVEWEARRKQQRENPPRWATLEEVEALTARIVEAKLCIH
jgi:hypothetical protein